MSPYPHIPISLYPRVPNPSPAPTPSRPHWDPPHPGLGSPVAVQGGGAVWGGLPVPPPYPRVPPQGAGHGAGGLPSLLALFCALCLVLPLF